MKFDTSFDEKVLQSNLSAWAQEHLARREKFLNIKNFVDDGFSKVCDVVISHDGWRYKNIDQNLMFSDHRSWVYFIVKGSTIVKVGETGNPLGIEEYWLYDDYELQPVASSKCRFGRLRKGDSTDSYIRASLRDFIKGGGNVSLWAKKCKTVVVNESIGGKSKTVFTSKHKSLEQEYLKYFETYLGTLPDLNKIKK
jgi:hypothetical protein